MKRLRRLKLSTDEKARSEDWFFSWLAVLVGVVIIASHIESGTSRWSTAAMAYAVKVPGSPATWGVVIFAAGCILVWGNSRDHPKALWWGYWVACWWFCFLASAAFGAVIEDLRDGTRHANLLAVVLLPAFGYLYQSRVNGKRNRSQ